MRIWVTASMTSFRSRRNAPSADTIQEMLLAQPMTGISKSGQARDGRVQVVAVGEENRQAERHEADEQMHQAAQDDRERQEFQRENHLGHVVRVDLHQVRGAPEALGEEVEDDQGGRRARSEKSIGPSSYWPGGVWG